MERIKYIPGDLVHIPKFGNNYTIMSSGKYYYEALDANYNDIVIENTDIVPIPLTPEILDKNGWEHKDDICWKHYPYFDLIIYIKERGLHIASVKDAIYLREVKYVHQLQQGLFGLNLDSNINI